MNRNEQGTSVDYVTAVEGYVKRANLRGQLWPMPVAGGLHCAAIQELARRGSVQWVDPTATSLGGWHWVARSIPSKNPQA